MALTDAMSRVASIAIVHETLSQAFDEIVEFDRVAVTAPDGRRCGCLVGWGVCDP